MRWIAYPNNYLWTLSFELIALVFLLFPTGRPASHRWRIVTRTTVALLAVDLVGSIFDDRTTAGNAGRLDNLLSAQGGTLEVRSVPGEGTTVIGRIRVRELEAVG